METTRRTALAGLGAGLGASLVGGGMASAAPASALPRAIERHPGFQPWKVMYDPDPLPMQMRVTTLNGAETPLWAWLGAGPTVLILWASWCSPCVAEKPAQSYMARRLAYLHSTTKIKALQAYDSRPLADARVTLDRIGAKDLETARASPEIERGFLQFFGPSVNDSKRTALPSLVLIGHGGVELGRAKGTMQSASGQSYWGDATTMQFLAGLDRLLMA